MIWLLFWAIVLAPGPARALDETIISIPQQPQGTMGQLDDAYMALIESTTTTAPVIPTAPILGTTVPTR